MRKLEIIFTSDTHGHIFPVNYPAGRADASGLLNMASQVEKDGNTLMIDGGDSLQGTPFVQYYREHQQECKALLADGKGGFFHPVAEAFRALGCDYFTLGNHDFNFGYDFLAEYVNAMGVPCICANVEDLGGKLPIQKEVVRVLENGLRVGITGIVTDWVNIWERKENLELLRVTDPIASARESLERLKSLCDVTVCVYHGGFEEDLENGKLLSDSGENVACKIARELNFDLLLTGHQHMPVAGKMLYGTWAVQPPAGASKYVHLYAEISEEEKIFASSLESVGEKHKEEPYAKLYPLEQAVQTWLDEPVGALSSAIEPEEKLPAGRYGSRLAELFNQVQLERTGADISCASLGNDPAGLKQSVTMRDICGAYLFDNTLVELEVDREVLRQMLERCASYFDLVDGKVVISDRFLKPKIEHYNYDFFTGIRYTFDLTRPVGDRVTELLLADGSELGDKSYRLVTNNYRATGTGGYPFLADCKVLWRGTEEMPEMLARYIEKHNPADVEGRALIMVLPADK